MQAMNNYENFRHGQNGEIYSEGLFNTVRGHRYPTEPAAAAEFCLPPPAEPVAPGRAPFEAYHSCPHLASLASPSRAVCSTTSLANGDSEEESLSTSRTMGLPSKGLDCMPLLVFVLVLCVFVTLAIWATALVQDEVRDRHIEAVDDADSAHHFAMFGGLKPSGGASMQTGTKKHVSRITARTEKRTRSKRPSTTLDDADVTTTGFEFRNVDDKENYREQPSGISGKYTHEMVKTGTLDNEGPTTVPPLKPIHRRRRLRRNKPSRRSTRRRPSKRIQRRRDARKQAAPPTAYSEKGGPDANSTGHGALNMSHPNRPAQKSTTSAG